MMARTLEMDISEMGPESLKWKEDIDLSAACALSLRNRKLFL